MPKDYYKQLLKELGVSDYRLRQFREKENAFREVRKEIEKANKYILGNETTTKDFNYQKLYEYIQQTGVTAKQAIEDIEEEYVLQTQRYLDYNLSSEIVDNIYEMWNFSSTVTNISHERFIRFLENFDEDKYSRLVEVIDMLHKYQDLSEDEIGNQYAVDYAIAEIISELQVIF